MKTKALLLFVVLSVLSVSAYGQTVLQPGSCVNINVCAASSGGGAPPVNPPASCPTNFHYEGNTCVPDTGTGGGGGGTTGDITCPGYDSTHVIDFPWVSPVRQYSGAFHVNDIIVVRFTTGNIDSADNNLPRVTGSEWQSPPSGRISTLSSKACDFGVQQFLGAQSAGNSIQVPFAIGLGSNFGYYPILQKNTTYYWNIKNAANQSCSAQNICDMQFELLKPGGL